MIHIQRLDRRDPADHIRNKGDETMALIDVIKWNSPKDVYAIKHPKTDLGTWSQLIVQETQEAMMMKEGRYLGPFGPGRHTLDTKNIPLLETFIRIPFGGDTPFTAEVWYVNKASALDVKWGTANPMQLKDPTYNVMLPVRAFGQFGVKINDTRKFLERLVGTLHAFTGKDLRSYFKGIVLSRTKDLVAEHIMHKKISILEISAYLSEISQVLETELGKEFDEFGMELLKFRVMSISAPEEDSAVKRLKEALAKKAEMDIMGYNYQQQKSFEVLQAAAKNEGMSGQVMGVGMGAGMGLGMGAAVGGQMNGIMGNMNTSMPPQPNPFGSSGSSGHQFHIYLNGKQMGPYPVSTLAEGIKTGQMTKGTQVWRQGMAEWTSAEQVPELNSLFQPQSTSPFGAQAGPPPMAQELSFYIHLNGEQQGPFPMKNLKEGVTSGQITQSTPVWRDGMSDWSEAGKVTELQALFKPAGPPAFGSASQGPPSYSGPPKAED